MIHAYEEQILVCVQYWKLYIVNHNKWKTFILGGTILLWWTYIDIKKTLDKTNPNQLLEESVRNERAFLAFSIIATFITVSKT